MNISFDLDSTLIPNGKEFEVENRGRIAKFLGIEELRKGTPELIADLQKKGYKVHIYTTSFRSKIKIRLTLKYYGIKVNRIVNQTENRKVLKSQNINASKYPPAFGFDLHIDDLKGIGVEGRKLNFKTLIIEPTDKSWGDKVKKGIAQTFDQKILKRLLEELWFQSNDCSQEIENVWFSIQEVAKSTGNTTKEVKKYLDLLFENKCISINSEKPLLLEFTEKGKRIKTGLEIEKLIKNLDIKMKN